MTLAPSTDSSEPTLSHQLLRLSELTRTRATPQLAGAGADFNGEPCLPPVHQGTEHIGRHHKPRWASYCVVGHDSATLHWGITAQRIIPSPHPPPRSPRLPAAGLISPRQGDQFPPPPSVSPAPLSAQRMITARWLPGISLSAGGPRCDNYGSTQPAGPGPVCSQCVNVESAARLVTGMRYVRQG